MIINKAPKATGTNTKDKPLPPRMAIIGFAPAGGWIVLNELITNTDKPTAIPSDTADAPIKAYITTPLKADNVCPKNILYGSAKGLLWTAITNTIVAPKGGINQISP